ncbi:type VII secretion target [Mycobacterium sp. D16R24]|uniref:type VII secretion target n=1 Tax=Mycobacterium sp. D16R24 TaxID=1855656 RepID=UPI001591E112|nr:type VII secretion target [Mycobacterium sp. D16R24]
MSQIRIDSDVLRQRAQGWRQWAEDLEGYPANYNEVHDNVYRQGAIMAPVANAASEVFAEQTTTYNRCGEHRRQIAAAADAAAIRLDAAEEAHRKEQQGVADG